MHDHSETTFDVQDIEQNRGVAAMSYIWILCLVPLLLKRDSAFASYHAKQGLVLFIVEVLAMLIAWIPVINVLVFFGLVTIAAIGVANATRGVALPLPLIGRWAGHFNI